jgi:hypothetical protein
MENKKIKRTGKRTTPTFNVYMDDELHKRFNIGVAKEKLKQVENGNKQTASKSSIVVQLVEKWCDKNGY